MPKYDKEKKIRVELFFDKKEDADIIEYMDRYGSSRAGWIRSALKEYVATKKYLLNASQQNLNVNQKEQQNNEQRTDKIPKLLILAQWVERSEDS